MKKSIYWELKYSNFYLFFGPSCDLVFISKPIPTKYIIKTAGVQVESRWSPWKGEKYCVKWCGMGWNPWTPHGVRGVHQESRWNPGGNRQKFGWAPCQINSTWSPGGLHESTWIPGGMTRNLWGSVKSSQNLIWDAMGHSATVEVPQKWPDCDVCWCFRTIYPASHISLPGAWNHRGRQICSRGTQAESTSSRCGYWG